jgi:hypothetical protein
MERELEPGLQLILVFFARERVVHFVQESPFRFVVQIVSNVKEVTPDV